MKSVERVITAFAAGISVGTLLGLLFAPSKGVETRQRIKEGAEEYYSKAGEIVEDIKDILMRKHDELADEMKETRENVKKTAKETKAEIDARLSEEM